MRYDGRAVFKRPDGHLIFMGPGRPVAGTYRIGDRTFTVSALGGARTALSAKAIEALDEAVARGEATFDPAQTPQEYFDALAEKAKRDLPSLADAEYVGVIPSAEHLALDREFRNAARLDGKRVALDMAKCREIQKNRLREIRAPKLAALDVEFMRALEAGDATRASQIAAKKQALRDVTKDPAIDAAKTVEELKAVVPAALRA